MISTMHGAFRLCLEGAKLYGNFVTFLCKGVSISFMVLILSLSSPLLMSFSSPLRMPVSALESSFKSCLGHCNRTISSTVTALGTFERLKGDAALI